MDNSLKDKLTLLIHSCDNFSDLWDAHIELLNKNWPHRSVRTLIVTDSTTNKHYDNVEILSTGNGKEITERIKSVIPYIDTEFVLVTLDDYFPIYPVEDEKIARLIDIMEKEGYDYIRLFKRPKSKLKKTNYENLYEFSLDGDYRVNLYVGIWRKSFMFQTVREELNAWNYEVSLTRIARSLNAKVAVSYGHEFDILDVVRKGQILYSANRYLKRHDLYHGNRSVRPISAEIKLWIRTRISDIASAILPVSVFVKIKRILVRCGIIRSFSAGKDIVN